MTLPGEPVPKGRPRFTRTGHAFTPARTRAYEKDLLEAAEAAMAGAAPFHGPLSVRVEARRGVPKSWPKKKRAQALSGLLMPLVTPDWDNYAKVIDALNGVVWIDDAHIVEGSAVKLYAAEPSLRVTLSYYVPPTMEDFL